MAELHIARPHGVSAHRRRRGFVAFCAALTALIATLLLHPFAAAADRRVTRADVTVQRPVETPARATASLSAEASEKEVEDPTALIGGIPERIFARLLGAGQPIRCGAGTEPLIALTFDDGPGVLTRQTVRLLRERGMTATFFLVGKLLDEARFEGLPALTATLGAVGDHTWDHVAMSRASMGELEAQIARTRRAIAGEAGERVTLFRPPLGARDRQLDAYVRSLGMLTILWSIESGDSQGASADRIFRTVRDSLSPGDIVLLHENRGTTQRALPRILDLIEARGYRAVTVPELLALDPPTRSQLRAGTCPA